jgi:hypothetical protein
MAFGFWISTATKPDKVNLVTSIFNLQSNALIRPVSVGLLVLPSQNCNRHGHHGQHGHAGAISTEFKKKATRLWNISYHGIT